MLLQTNCGASKKQTLIEQARYCSGCMPAPMHLVAPDRKMCGIQREYFLGIFGGGSTMLG